MMKGRSKNGGAAFDSLGKIYAVGSKTRKNAAWLSVPVQSFVWIPRCCDAVLIRALLGLETRAG